jgi:hypothetical protein
MITIPRRARAITIAGIAVLVAGIGLFFQQHHAGASQGQPLASDPILAGAIDVHTHPAPDGQERSISAMEYARLVAASGMRGFVFKQHDDHTAGLVYLIRQEVPGIEVFGALVLNRAMGGLNVDAIERFARITGGWGRVVFMPTRDVAQVPVVRDGELLPETKAVIAAIAAARTVDSNGRLVLATGHVPPEESLLILREAKAAGITGLMVTHPMSRWSVEQMREAASLGAYLEFTADLAAGGTGPEVEERLQRTAEAIRAVGAEHSIISSDLGRADLPLLTPDGLAVFAAGLRRHGFTDQQLVVMLRDNPTRFLGLDGDASSSR